jgi:hypothetical protein
LIDDIENEDHQTKLDNIFHYGSLYRLIYNQSVIPDLETHYYNCTKISYHLHISQIEINQLEYYVYSNMIVFLTRIIEEENNRNGANQEGADHSAEYKKMMSASKKNFSPSKMKYPSIPKI